MSSAWYGTPSLSGGALAPLLIPVLFWHRRRPPSSFEQSWSSCDHNCSGRRTGEPQAPRGRAVCDAGRTSLMAVDPSRSLMPAWMPRFNKSVTNRVQGLWAPYLPPYAVIVHRGRRSGREYRTPVTALKRGRTLIVPLPYSAQAQWVRNVLTAGEATVVRGGRVRRVGSPRVVTDAYPPQLARVPAAISRRVPVLVLDLVDR